MDSKIGSIIGLIAFIVLLLLFITAFQICEILMSFTISGSLASICHPYQLIDFDVHDAIDNDQVRIHSICLPVSTVLVVLIILIIRFICIIVLK